MTWIYTKIGFLTTWALPAPEKREDSQKKPSNPGIVAKTKTRYCLMIITEFGYKARFLAWWICGIFLFSNNELNIT